MSLEGLILWLSLEGVSTGEFTGALQAILGLDAPALSAASRPPRHACRPW